MGAGLLLDIDTVAWLAISLAIGLVYALEALNSSVEAAVDLASPEWNRAAALAKDAAAAAVLIAAFTALVVAGIVFWPRIGDLGPAVAHAWAVRPLPVAAWIGVTGVLLASGVLVRRRR